MQLLAKPLLTIDKAKKITVKELNGKIYLMITPKRFIGMGDTLEQAIQYANARTFTTGYRIE